MYKRDIFIRHLDNIRLYVRAKEISIFHQQLNDSLEGVEKSHITHGVSVKNIKLLETTVVKSIEQHTHVNKPNSVHVFQHDEMTTFVKLTNSMFIALEDALTKPTKTLIPRRMSKATAYPAQSYWLKLVYSEACPQWLNEPSFADSG